MSKSLITQAEYARQKGVSPARISHLVSKGVIKLVDGFVDPTAADAAIAAAAHPGYAKVLGRPTKDNTPGSYAEAATAEKHFKALLAELDLRERQGELVNAADMQHELARLFVNLKTRLRSIPSKSAQTIAHIKMSGLSGRELMGKIQTLMLCDIDEALLEIANWNLKKKEGKESNGGK